MTGDGSIALRLQPISAASFAPYGWLIDAEAAFAGRHERAINQGSSRRVDGFGALSFQAEAGRPCLTVFRASARDPQGPWRLLERHRLGTQSFIPLGGVACVVLVALDRGDGSGPDPATLAAFRVSGRQGITLHPGTWHHGLIALADGDFVVLERQAEAEDCDLAELATPVRLEP